MRVSFDRSTTMTPWNRDPLYLYANSIEIRISPINVSPIASAVNPKILKARSALG